MYVFESVFETGGQFWPKVFRRFVFGLIIAQVRISASAEDEDVHACVTTTQTDSLTKNNEKR